MDGVGQRCFRLHCLTEINPRGAHLLAEFRRWANLFFGSVMNAFMVLDADGGGALTRSEFKKSATKYCFRGDREELFTLLDIGGDGDITVEEMAFLDEWEITEVCDEPIPTFHEVERMLRRSKSPYSDEDQAVKGMQICCCQRSTQGCLQEHAAVLELSRETWSKRCSRTRLSTDPWLEPICWTSLVVIYRKSDHSHLGARNRIVRATSSTPASCQARSICQLRFQAAKPYAARSQATIPPQ